MTLGLLALCGGLRVILSQTHWPGCAKECFSYHRSRVDQPPSTSKTLFLNVTTGATERDTRTKFSDRDDLPPNF